MGGRESRIVALMLYEGDGEPGSTMVEVILPLRRGSVESDWATEVLVEVDRV